MLYPESDTLVSKKIFLESEISKIDSYFAQEPMQHIDAWKISYHTSIEHPRVNSILAEYLELKLLVRLNALRCDDCQMDSELTGPGHAICFNCDKNLTAKTNSIVSIMKIAPEKVVATASKDAARLISCAPLLLKDIQNCLQNQEVIFVVGAGASIAATQNHSSSSWKGLLENGLERCRQMASGLTSEKWFEAAKLELESGDAESYMSVAEKITSKLSAINELRRFFKDEVGSLHVSDNSLLRSIAAFDLPIMTTNYDSLFEETTSVPTISWHQTDRLDDWIRGHRKAILHVHGHWDDDPAQIIFGTSSYARITSNLHFQTMLKTIRGCRTLVYICFGSGLDDPNFNAFFKWGATIFRDTNQRQFKLCRKSDPPLSQLEIDSKISRIEYGDYHTDLVPFLESLRHSVRNQTTS